MEEVSRGEDGKLQRQAREGRGVRDYEVTHGTLFIHRVTMQAESEWELRQRLEREHPEWFPIRIEVIRN